MRPRQKSTWPAIFFLAGLAGCADLPRARIVATDPRLRELAELAAEQWNATGCVQLEVSGVSGNVVLQRWPAGTAWPWDGDVAAMHVEQAGERNVWLSPLYRFGDVDHDATALDLQSVLTHELGHVAGIHGHVAFRDATMWDWTRMGTTHQRTITRADEDALCAVWRDE